MKRASNLYEQIIEYSNIRVAFIKALRGKRKSLEVIRFCMNINQNLQKIQNRLLSKNPHFGDYYQFKIYDPKERIISAVSFDQRIMHHAIMNVLEPIFERQLIFNTYACRKGKGSHKAVIYAHQMAKKSKYFLKLDVRKYFDSINHQILKERLQKIIKDKKVLQLLFGIIDSYNSVNCHARADFASHIGLPIGNLTSQFFANHYLSCLDHYILEHLKPKGYARYMDDFVLFSNDKKELQVMNKKIGIFVQEKLKLTLKQAIINSTTNGVPFLGYRVSKKAIKLLQKSKRRMKKNLSNITYLYKTGKITKQEAQDRSTAIVAVKKLTFF